MTDYRNDIEKYLRGELSPAERHALERKALDDPFLADALEGAEQIDATTFSKDVGELNAKLAGKKNERAWLWPMRIAAGLAIVAVSSFIVWSVVDTDVTREEIALEKSEPQALSPVTTDSAQAATGELSSSGSEQQQPAASPVSRDRDVATRSAGPSSAQHGRQQPAASEPIAKNEPAAETVAVTEKEEARPADIKADELKIEDSKVSESVAKATPAEQDVSLKQKDKAGAEQRARKASSFDDLQKAAADKKASGLASSFTSNVISGQVTFAEDGSPLPGVNVTVKGTAIATATDAQGNYQITAPTPVSNTTLVYSFIGLQNTEVKVEEKQEVNVQMQADNSQLSEVVVTGYGERNDAGAAPPTIEQARPETGTRAFRQYLEKNLRYPEQAKANKTEGRVTVEFTVEPSGTLTNFIIIRGIGSGCDEELIRLIKEGPKWIPTKKDNVPVQDKVKVRLKFELPE